MVISKEEKHKEKNRIITELYDSNIIQVKVLGMAQRHGISRFTEIHLDCIQEVFMNLSAKPADYIIDMYNDDPNRLIGLCVRIASWRCFYNYQKKDKNPKQSLASFIMHGSVFARNLSIDNDTAHLFDDFFLEKEDKNNEGVKFDEFWDTIIEGLTDEEHELLIYFLNLKRKQGRLDNENKNKLERLTNAIKSIIIKKELNVQTPLHKRYKQETFASVEQKEKYIDDMENLFKDINHLMPAWNRKKVLESEKPILRRVYNQLQPGVSMDLQCGGCVKYYMEFIMDYYNREWPKYQARLQAYNTSIEEPGLEVEEDKKVLRPKRKRIKKV